jgi:putative ABC transport system permease protein
MNSLKVAGFLAVKSVVRGNAWVLLLTVTMLMLVYLNLIFAPSLVEGVVNTINDKIINTLTGHIIVESKGEDRAIGNVTDLISRIEALDGVIAVSARNDLAADIVYEEERTTAVVYAIDPDRDKKVFEISENMVEGSYLDAEDTDQILLGIQVAGSDREGLELYSSSLKAVHAGDQVVVDYANGLQKQYTVKGIFQVELIQTDVKTFITEKEFANLNPLISDQASTLHVRTAEDTGLEPIVEQIEDIRGGLRFQTWEDVAGVLRSMTDTLDRIIRILRVIALVVAAITIFIITYVDLVNKRRQIGIQRAIGITSAVIILSYIFRAILYAVVGTLVAALIFAYIALPLEARHPFHFPFGDVFLALSVQHLLSSALILWGVSIVSAFIPAWQTIRIKIIDAIWAS